ncbi:ABC transporter permease [Rasiella rasia]|uniref:ABC transporter permease n=1 Tax=Rasiella rasia TaxID=2744027 RepID=A0A6G6GNN5_9FLAO|nr:ABC transporter permease [Rasiella rasia]QIE60159.1 ABC transporter permease [Rasiella rasia]
MLNKDRWNEILEALSANPFRTLLTAFGVFWGIFILVVLLALTTGLRNGVSKDFGDFATNSIFMWGQGTSKPYKGLPKGRYVRFKVEDVAVLKEKMPELKYVSPRGQLGGYNGANNVTRNEKTGAFTVSGDYPEYIKQQPMDITGGRFISYSDINERRKGVVIGSGVVTSLFDVGEDPIGEYIKISGVNFMVIGTFNAPSNNGNNEELANTIYVPFTTFNQVFNRGDQVGWMAITAYDEYSITSLKPRILEIMREQRTIHPEDERAIGNFDRAEAFGRITGLFDILKFVGFFVGGLILASGMIGVINILLISVKERTNEIGVRRALGATPWQVRGQIIQESLIITLVSGMAGVAGGAGLIWIMNYALEQSGPVDNFANPSVNVAVIITALVILIISGILAGLFPAVRATRIKPVDALRTE